MNNKSIPLTALLLTMVMSIFTNTLQAQFVDSVIIFRPEPGLNDSTDQGGLQGGKDVQFYRSFPTTNFAADPVIYSFPISNCNDADASSFIQFDISTLPALVDSVKVGFTHWPHTSYCYSNCIADFYFHKILEPWYEQEVTYNNQPQFDSIPFLGPVHFTFPNNLGQQEYDITDVYNQWKSGVLVNNGFTIKSPTVGCNNVAVQFTVYSSDDTVVSARPYLKIFYKHNITSVQDKIVAQDNLILYPNPSKNQVTINNISTPAEIQIFNLEGKLVYRQTTYKTIETIDVSNLDNTFYLIKVISNKSTITKKLFINR